MSNNKIVILNNLLDDFKKEIKLFKNKQKIIEFKNIFLKKNIAPLYKTLAEIEDKKTFGAALNEIKVNIELITEASISLLVSDECSKTPLPFEEINLFKNGHKHPLNLIIKEVSNFFKLFNFELINGNEVSEILYNFDNLNITKDHVARDIHDTFFIDDKYVLRTHCTSNTAKVLHKNKSEDIRIFSYGNVYRKDEDDATHSHQFMQVDFIWLKKDFTLSNLKWIINSFIQYLFGDKLKTRYRLSYFPFTEPSFEVDVECWNCNTNGCSICKKSGWIEVLGAGMLHQNVIKNTNTNGINSGMAAGIGIERIAMLKYGINDIRDFYNNDFDLIKQFKSN